MSPNEGYNWIFKRDENNIQAVLANAYLALLHLRKISTLNKNRTLEDNVARYI